MEKEKRIGNRVASPILLECTPRLILVLRGLVRGKGRPIESRLNPYERVAPIIPFSLLYHRAFRSIQRLSRTFDDLNEIIVIVT